MDRPVLINARAAARPELGGVERWARELVQRLPLIDAARYAVVRPPPRLVHRAGHAWEQCALPALAARRRAPLLLNPANLAPLGFSRNVVVIHDAAALRQPAWYSATYVTWQRALLPALARRARHLVTVSEFSKRELVELLGADPARITVIPGGVDRRFAPNADPEPARVALHLERPYVLTVASRTARKNLGALRLAAHRLRRQGIEMVAAGGGRPQFRAESGDLGVRWIGGVPDEYLPGLYAGALAFVLPSRYEGFGLTCIEAMASGTPVVASERGALPEVLGNAALLVDPDDQDAVATAIERAIEDTTLRDGGPRHAAHYSWERTAGEVHELLCRLSDSR